MSESAEATARPSRAVTREPGAGPGARRRRANWRWIVVALLLVLACYAPFQLVPFRVFQLTMVLIYAVALLGLNLLVGHAGQISLGHGAFFAVGAYTAAIMLIAGTRPIRPRCRSPPRWRSLLGLALGVPAMRLRGLYLALVTLAIAVFLVPLLKRFESVTGGSMGLTAGQAGSRRRGRAGRGPVAVLPRRWPWPSWPFLLARSLLRSRVGRALHAIRDNEAAAEVMGVRLSFYKTLAFAWSAMFAGSRRAASTPG